MRFTPGNIVSGTIKNRKNLKPVVRTRIYLVKICVKFVSSVKSGQLLAVRLRSPRTQLF